jgi:hypothetical protein
MAVVVLWKTYIINPQMYLPPELVAIILQSVVALPAKLLTAHNPSNSDDESEFGSEHTEDSESENPEEDEYQHTKDDQDQETDSDRRDDDDDEQDESGDHGSSEEESDN